MLQGSTLQLCSTANTGLVHVSEQHHCGLPCLLPPQSPSGAVGTAPSCRADCGRPCLGDEYMANYKSTIDWTEVSDLRDARRLYTFYKCRNIILSSDCPYSVNNDVVSSEKNRRRDEILWFDLIGILRHCIRSLAAID
jgi:hypothetical protein